MLYDEKFSRNLPTLTSGEQKIVRSSVFSIIGLGGTGGFAFECLARLGAERFILFDHDRFELTNFNRQLLASDRTIDKKKIDAAAARAKTINKKIRIKKFGEFDSSKIKGASIIIDATDNLETKALVARSCHEKSIPYIFCGAEGSRGMVSVFKNYSFEKAFQLGDKKPPIAFSRCSSIICPAAALAGVLAASAALNVVIGKPHIKAPSALFFDLFDKRVFWKARLG